MSKGAKLSLLMISLTILLMAALMSGVIKSEHWEIKDIELDAEFKRVNPEQIRIAVAAYPERSFFRVSADDIRQSLSQIPWVQKVSISKKWPDKLVIKIREHKAVAVWNENKLLNQNGEVFEVDSIDDLSALPQISGKPNSSQKIWDKFIRYNDIIKLIGCDIKSASVSNRGGWNLYLSNSVDIYLGSEQMDAKLVRLADTWIKLLKKNSETPQYIDLRYTNGYVVKWPQTEINISNKSQDTENNNG
jgi:cell division protein FtsQ